MALDFGMLAALNLALQLILTAALVLALLQAKKKRFNSHCTIMRLIVSAQILAVLGAMLPAMYSLGSIAPLFEAEVLVHHGLGLGVIILWAYINLVYLRRLDARISPTIAMRTAAAFWVISLLLGIHLYSKLYF